MRNQTLLKHTARTLLIVIGVMALLLALGPSADADGPNRETIVLNVAKRHPDAADRNPGTSRLPLATVSEAAQRAVSLTRRGHPVRVSVHPGTYRESITIQGKPSDAPIELIGHGRPVITGSDVLDGWSRIGNTRVYSHRWARGWGLTPIPPAWYEIRSYLRDNPLIRRREMFFVGGDLLTQVRRRREVNSKPGTFFVNDRTKKVFVHLRSGDTTDQPKLEAAVRPRLLLVKGVANFEIRGFAFRHAATPMADAGAVAITESTDGRVVDNTFHWNNGLGLTFSRVDRIGVARNTANHNGVGGIAGSRSRDVLMLGNETSYNNWRGAMGAGQDDPRPVDPNYTDFATGQKFLRMRDATFVGHRSVGNLTGGLWFDYDNSRVTVIGSQLRNNATHGIFLEASQGPFDLQGNTICGNETGVLISDAQGGHLAGNVIGDNRLGQIFLVGGNDPRSVDDWETGQRSPIESEDWRFQNNVVAVPQGARAISTVLPQARWQTFVSSLLSRVNLWMHGDDARIFRIAGGQNLDLQGWQEHSGQDHSSAAASINEDCPEPPELPTP